MTNSDTIPKGPVIEATAGTLSSSSNLVTPENLAVVQILAIDCFMQLLVLPNDLPVFLNG